MKENQVYRDLGKDVIAAQNSDRDAQERIIVCVRDMIYYTCLKMLRSEDRAMDATQDITMTIYERLGTLKDPTAYVGWVRRITANYCKNALSAKNVEFLAPKTEDENDPFAAYESLDEQTVPEKVLEKNETQALIRKIIDELPDEQRMCVLMYYFHEMKTREIADTLGVPEGTIKSRLNYARKAIKCSLDQYEEKGFRLYSMMAVPFFGTLIESINRTAGSGIAAASSVSESILNGIAQKISEGCTVLNSIAQKIAEGWEILTGAAQKVTVGIVATTTVVVATGASVALTMPKEDASTKNRNAEIVASETVRERKHRSSREQSCWESIMSDVRENVFIETEPEETQQEQQESNFSPARREHDSNVGGEIAASSELPADPEETEQDTPVETQPTDPEEDIPEEEQPEQPTDPEEEKPAEPGTREHEFEEPVEEETQPEERAWSAWSTEQPPEGAEIREKTCYRLVTIRKEQQDPDENPGKGSVPTIVYTYGEWSDEPIELPVLIDAQTRIEVGTFYSWR